MVLARKLPFVYRPVVRPTLGLSGAVLCQACGKCEPHPIATRGLAEILIPKRKTHYYHIYDWDQVGKASSDNKVSISGLAFLPSRHNPRPFWFTALRFICWQNQVLQQRYILPHDPRRLQWYFTPRRRQYHLSDWKVSRRGFDLSQLDSPTLLLGGSLVPLGAGWMHFLHDVDGAHSTGSLFVERLFAQLAF